MAETLHIYIHDRWRAAASSGTANLFNRMAKALPGWRLVFHPDDPKELDRAEARGYGLFHMQEPTAPSILCLRRAYEYPFWRIERTNERWNFDVALATFQPDAESHSDMRRFCARWRRRVFPTATPRRGGFIFMPLQGHLSRHRSFQSMSPIEMIGATLAGDRRPIFATLHPKETYAEADLQALERLERAFPRFRVSRAGSDRLLAWCDMVVTQNSSLAFRGYLIEKPAVLFAGADFHHIAGSVPRDGLDDAFHLARETAPAFAAYVWWFWVRHAINAGSPDAEQQIRQRLASHGWPVA